MDASAIQRIEELAVTAAANDVIARSAVTPSVALPRETLVHSLERFKDRPSRFRSTFKTVTPSDFIVYLTQHQTDASAVFIDARQHKATAIIDFGDPVGGAEWGEHRAELALEKTPEHEALLKVSGRPLTQRELTDWLEDFGYCITPQIDGSDLLMSKAIQAIRKLDLKATASKTIEDGDFRAARSSMEQVEVQQGENPLPSSFNFVGPLFSDTLSRTVQIRLSVLTSEPQPALVLRIQGYDRLMNDIAKEVEARIREAADDVDVYSGTISINQPKTT